MAILTFIFSLLCIFQQYIPFGSLFAQLGTDTKKQIQSKGDLEMDHVKEQQKEKAPRRTDSKNEKSTCGTETNKDKVKSTDQHKN
jgi:hypothetical protein